MPPSWSCPSASPTFRPPTGGRAVITIRYFVRPVRCEGTELAEGCLWRLLLSGSLSRGLIMPRSTWAELAVKAPPPPRRRWRWGCPSETLWCPCPWTRRSTRTLPPPRDLRLLTYIKEGKTVPSGVFTVTMVGFRLVWRPLPNVNTLKNVFNENYHKYQYYKYHKYHILRRYCISFSRLHCT